MHHSKAPPKAWPLTMQMNHHLSNEALKRGEGGRTCLDSAPHTSPSFGGGPKRKEDINYFSPRSDLMAQAAADHFTCITI